MNIKNSNFSKLKVLPSYTKFIYLPYRLIRKELKIPEPLEKPKRNPECSTLSTVYKADVM